LSVHAFFFSAGGAERAPEVADVACIDDEKVGIAEDFGSVQFALQFYRRQVYKLFWGAVAE